jgi:thiamine-phosphate pyrophosphorylase
LSGKLLQSFPSRARALKGGVSRCRLYLISPPAFTAKDFAPAREAALAGGDVAAVQLRLKDAPDEDVLRAGEWLKPMVQGAGAALIINDRPDLAARLDADGVHVGRSDSSVAEARRLLGKDKMIGATAHNSRHLAIEAAEAGADYVAFGAFYPSDTKAAEFHADPDILDIWSGTTDVPCVAIGGITLDNCAPLIQAGADFLAVANGVWKYKEGPQAAVAAFNALFDEMSQTPR